MVSKAISITFNQRYCHLWKTSKILFSCSVFCVGVYVWAHVNFSGRRDFSFHQIFLKRISVPYTTEPLFWLQLFNCYDPNATQVSRSPIKHLPPLLVSTAPVIVMNWPWKGTLDQMDVICNRRLPLAWIIIQVSVPGPWQSLRNQGVCVSATFSVWLSVSSRRSAS